LEAPHKELAVTTAQGKRDVALVHLMHDSCLRRGECVGLDLVDVDMQRGQVAIIGKDKTDREWLTISTQAKDALVQWITARGDEPVPLFIRLDPARTGNERITGDSVNRIVNKLGAKSGLKRKVRAHGLRHQGITRALDLTNGNVRMVQGLSRHADPRTLMKVRRLAPRRCWHAGPDAGERRAVIGSPGRKREARYAEGVV
jgi:integrase/recombinase XerC